TRESIAMTAPVTQARAEKIAMTAPVTQQAAGSDETWTVSFVMPAQYTLDTLPIPDDARVQLAEVPARVVAVRRYSGTWSQRRYQRELGELREALKRDGVVIIGEPIFARYNSPFSLPPLRRNEIWIEVAPAPSAPIALPSNTR
ncbi:MAG TPA: heme-binding protein, partial [Steroidobacteraceae bacterium]|nr:heme-binding protein [Steroidobacteraceae bacterium]